VYLAYDILASTVDIATVASIKSISQIDSTDMDYHLTTRLITLKHLMCFS